MLNPHIYLIASLQHYFQTLLLQSLCPCFLKSSSQSGDRDLGICCLVEVETNLSWLIHSVVRVSVAQSLTNVPRKRDCGHLDSNLVWSVVV